MIPTRPYFVRAIYEWSADNGFTPYLMVDAIRDDVVVPQEHVENGRIVLNISSTAVQSLVITNEIIEFSARFGGVPREIHVPMGAVLGIYAKENGQGLFFDAEPDPDDDPPGSGGDEPGDSKASRRPSLKVVK